jgi:hypothetical protein
MSSDRPGIGLNSEGMAVESGFVAWARSLNLRGGNFNIGQ